MIPFRGWLIPIAAATALITTGVRARADDVKIDCDLVRYKVAEYGEAKALAWALKNGFTWRQINSARKCLK